ncbi:hypothetical protein [Cytophaga aurantiaca]|uniref:hypothetical protein n=1 Tax=Cytophaga aurantiaca TaxID=29530 RepID=UPI000372CAF0|nr:hypothetical protein [Cytophaga aurantiaca]
MSFQEEIFDKIEAYLSGELDAGEKTAFENQVAADDLLKAEVEKHKVANALIMEQRLLSVKNIFQEERIKDSGSNGLSKPFGFILLAVAAIGIGTSVYLLNKKDDVISSKKDENQSNQIVSTTITPDNKNVSGNKELTTKDASQSVATTTDNGFHKQQIQQMEEQLRVDEKGTLYIDSSSIQKTDVRPVTHAVKTIDEIKTAPDPCAHVTIQANIKPSPSCDYKSTGNILVSNINGGTKPYSVSISSSSDESVVNGELEKGVYQAIVRDANGCTHKYSNIVVAEKDCPVDYSFNPFYGDEEIYIGPSGVEGQIEIYDKAGVLYYQRAIHAMVAFKWSGMGNGNQIIPGYYIFVINYADGTSKRGSITIVQ